MFKIATRWVWKEITTIWKWFWKNVLDSNFLLAVVAAFAIYFSCRIGFQQNKISNDLVKLESYAQVIVVGVTGEENKKILNDCSFLKGLQDSVPNSINGDNSLAFKILNIGNKPAFLSDLISPDDPGFLEKSINQEKKFNMPLPPLSDLKDWNDERVYFPLCLTKPKSDLRMNYTLCYKDILNKKHEINFDVVYFKEKDMAQIQNYTQKY